MSSNPREWLGLELSGGRYRITSRLGEGGMGFVYRADDANLQTSVVIKVPRRALLDEPRFAQRFKREIKSLVALSHPHVVKILDVGEQEGIPFAVMQYLDGGDLQSRRGQASNRQLVAESLAMLQVWLPDVASALDFVHRRGYVHRDIKPENVLFDAEGHAYLSDFGVAKVVHDAESASEGGQKTGTGMVLGTPGYMAPELIMGQEITGCADQYALAVTVYDSLAGRPPFQGKSSSAILVEQATKEVPALDKVQPSVPAALSSVVLRGLAKDPQDRYTTCVEFAEAVLEAVPPVPERPSTSIEQPAFLSRPPTMVEQPAVPTGPATMIETPANPLASPDAVATQLMRNTATQPRRKKSPPEKRRPWTLKKKLFMSGAAVGVLAFAVVTGLLLEASKRASALANAIAEQRWEDALLIDEDNAEALIGRANESLASSSPDLASIQSDLERAESLKPDASGLNEAKGKVYALQSVASSQRGDLTTGELKLQEAEALGVGTTYTENARLALAKAYASRAEASVNTGNNSQAIADANKALSFDPSVTLPATVKIAATEMRASELVSAYEQNPSDQTRTAATEGIAELEVVMELEQVDAQSTALATLQAKMRSIALATAESNATDLVDAYEQSPSERSLTEAIAGLSRLEAMSFSSSTLVRLRVRLSTTYIDWLDSLSVDEAFKEVQSRSDRGLNSQTQASAVRLVGSKLVRRFRAYLSTTDYSSASRDYAMIGNLDRSAAEQLAGDWLKIPQQDYGNLPPSVLSNLPPSVLSNLPPSVIGQIPPMKNSIGMELKLIPSGSFTMGSDNGDSDEKPAHQVRLSQRFLLGVHEVTQEQYELVMGSNPSKFKGAQRPVEQVSWDDAMEFCQKLSALPEERSAGRVYRLPTEAEWEYACRAGTTTAYGFGDDASDLGDYAWYLSNSGKQTHPAGQKQPNSWGLYDMHGNVFEWCADRYGGYPSGSVTDPTGDQSGSGRVVRGGSWGDSAGICRSADRYGFAPSFRFNDNGFRVACVPSGQ